MRVTLPRLSQFAFRPTPLRSAPKYPRPRPGTAERPPYRAPDPLLNNPKATVTKLGGKDGEQELTFIHRPPPSAPTPYSLSVAPASPLLRPRSNIIDTTEKETGQSQSPSFALLPPTISPQTPQTEPPRMSDENLARLKSLRRSDPLFYTRGKLAKMFKCSPTFVGMVAPLKKSQCRATHKVLKEKHEIARERWSEKHEIVMSIRKKRKELW